jgi:hypothetical protein
MTSSQGRQWVVGCGYYPIVGDSLVHNYQETILMVGITGSLVKIVKQELEVDDTLPRCYDVLAFSIFSKLSDSSSSKELTPLLLSTKLLKNII